MLVKINISTGLVKLFKNLPLMWVEFESGELQNYVESSFFQRHKPAA